METVIILTTTVYVQNKCYVFQTDPTERIKMYLKSINQWLEKTNFKIFLVENSGYPFNEFSESERFKKICFNESTLPEAQYLIGNNSKGASELFSINYTKPFLPKNCFVIKITGRYFISNFEKYLKNNLFDHDVISQKSKNRCEIVGCHIKHFDTLFNLNNIVNHPSGSDWLV